MESSMIRTLQAPARCVHCRHRANREYHRADDSWVPLCAAEQCLRDEWSLDEREGGR
jgi:hypothetical protein